MLRRPRSTRPAQRAAAVAAALVIAAPRGAAAQLPEAPPASDDAPPAPDEAPAIEAAPDGEKEQAIAHFNRGLSLYDQGSWAAALAEFLHARRLYPLRNATFNAGFCLEKLGRHDEALEMFEASIREFGAAGQTGDKEKAQRKVVDLLRRVASLEIEGAEPGAAIAIDGRDRGEFPPAAPLRVVAGSHLLRVTKRGFEPFERLVDAPGGQLVRVQARLRPATRSGRLVVAEQGGRPLEVVVDGVAVGKTPWEGQIPIGEHVVLLRGDGDVGTPPVPVAIELDRTTPLTLAAEELAASLRVVPTPANASVAIDGVTVGRGVWEGRLRAGAHRVEVAAPGFTPEARRVTLERGRPHVVEARLGRDDGSPFWRKPPRPPRFVLELGAAAAVVPTFGGDVAGACIEDCALGLGGGGMFVLHAGYELGMGLGFGVAAGYLAAAQSTTGRVTEVVPVGLPPNAGTADDRLALQGALAGAWVGFTLGERAPLHFRIGAGALLGALTDTRAGRFTSSAGPGARAGQRYDVGPIAERHDARFVYVAPEVRVGLPLGRRLAMNAGIAAPVLFRAQRVTWDEAGTHHVRAGEDGFGRFTTDDLVGPVLVAITPGIGLRYDF